MAVKPRQGRADRPTNPAAVGALSPPEYMASVWSREKEREGERKGAHAFPPLQVQKKLQRHLHAKAASETQMEVNPGNRSISKSYEQQVAMLSSVRR